MKSRLVIDIEHHPAVDSVAKLAKWLDAIVPDLYAVRDYQISQEVVEE